MISQHVKKTPGLFDPGMNYMSTLGYGVLVLIKVSLYTSWYPTYSLSQVSSSATIVIIAVSYESIKQRNEYLLSWPRNITSELLLLSVSYKARLLPPLCFSAL